MSVKHWMSWENGVDLGGFTKPGLAAPNVFIHVARMVHTPVGSAPSGMIFYQPDPATAPVIMGFVSHDPVVSAYFGPRIFAGTPFENAPALVGKIEIAIAADVASATVTVGGFIFQTKLSKLQTPAVVHRTPGPMTPFVQQALEAISDSASLSVNGVVIPITVPPVGISGGAAAVWSPCGHYAR